MTDKPEGPRNRRAVDALADVACARMEPGEEPLAYARRLKAIAARWFADESRRKAERKAFTRQCDAGTANPKDEEVKP